MTIDEIKNILKRKAIIFETGGKHPTKQINESWIGRVGFSLVTEELPIDSNGDSMYPVAMIFLNEFPYVPKSLKEIGMLSIFFSESIYDHLAKEDYEGYFAIREYKNVDALKPCDWTSKYIKPFPLTGKLVENDYPVWDGCDIPSSIFDEIIRLEDKEEIDYFEDIAEDCYPMHKLGGYGAFCQSGISFGDDYEFVLQISSDEKACFNVVDSGNFYFYKNSSTNDWKLHCDFY